MRTTEIAEEKGSAEVRVGADGDVASSVETTSVARQAG